MFRKLLLPLAATALLAGCVTTAPYGYRDGAQGDYYYGAPSVDYRYRGYGDPYSYGPYRPGISVYGRYGYGYPYYSPYYRNPYYGYPYYGYPYGYPRPVYRPRPGTPDHRPDGSPWRHLDGAVRRRQPEGGTAGVPTPSVPQVTRPDPGSFTPAPRPRVGGDEGGSTMGGMIRRARRGSQQDE